MARISALRGASASSHANARLEPAPAPRAPCRRSREVAARTLTNRIDVQRNPAAMARREVSTRSSITALAALLALWAGGCARAPPERAAKADALEDAGVAPPTAAGPAAALPPLESTPAILPLAAVGFPDAVVSVPTGARSARPIVVAAHGLWDPPEGLCDNWRWIVGSRAWVLCPRGEPMPDKTFRYRSGPALASEIDAGARALKERYPGYVDDVPMLFAGFSLGAILGAWVVVHDPARYPWAILTEGGEDRFNAANARAYARGGGRRVLFACGLAFRVATARRAARTLEVAGVGARVVLGRLPDAGEFIHWYNGPVAEETRAQLPWILEDDPRWR